MFDRFTAATRPEIAEPTKIRAGMLPSVALDLKVSLHQRLIDKINLAVLETMTREQVAEQITPLVSRMLAEDRQALNHSEY